jgi:hypothetical protein
MVRYIALVLPIFLCSFLGFFEFLLGFSFGSNDQLKNKGDGPISLGILKDINCKSPWKQFSQKWIGFFNYNLQSFSWGKSQKDQLVARGSMFKTS